VLLLHGTGASTHSWRGVAARLALRFQVLSLDLPGHAFTDAALPEQQSLPGMAKAVAALLSELQITPAIVVGHSAGAAIGLRMVLDGLVPAQAVVSFNGALLPLGGLPGQLFLPAARLLARNPLVPRLFARHAQDQRVLQRLIGSTGSALDAEGSALYGRLIRSPAHAAGALAMMAGWDLRPLAHDLPSLRVPLRLVAGDNDRTVSPSVAVRVKALVPGATLTRMAGLGHLAHEEAPQAAVKIIEDVSSEAGVWR
jgi:magnesium chelatase accessory protein